MSKRADKWLNDLKKDHGLAGMKGPEAGIEIVCRIVITEPSNLEYIDEVLEKCREYGAAEITRQERLQDA